LNVFGEIVLKNTMGRLAGAVLACALITLTVAPAASAQTTDPTPTSEVTETSAPSEPPTPTSSSVPDPTPSEPPVVTTPSSPTTSKPPVDPNPTSTSKPTETPDPTEPTEPPEEPYKDGLVYGIDFGDGEAVLVISCASGAPENVTSPDFDITAGPFQDEVDGRFWGYGLKLHAGAVVNGEDVRVSFSCGGKQYGDVPVPPAGGAGGGGVVPEKKTEKAQVKYAPKGGVATGFGGTAQG
jgi:hypothetical protein